MSHSVTFRNLTKKYGDNTAVNGIDFSIQEGEFFTILGPSGCGKTTLLRMIAGFNSIENGQILFDDRVMNDIPAYQRNIGMVFQNYAIFPHMTIHKNVAYGLKARKLPKTEIAARVSEMLKLMHIEQYRDRDPSQLSGGQQQRVALARALVIHPTILLMDEPLSNLDAKLRIDMRTAIKKIQKELNITTIYVTHDQEEALAMSDRIAVMNSGVVEQIGTPQDIYSKPATAFVAGFIGTTNFLDGELTESGVPPASDASGPGASAAVSVPGFGAIPVSGRPAYAGSVRLAIRPEDIHLTETHGGDAEGRISLVTFLGDYISYEVELGGGQLVEVNEYAKDTDVLRAVGDRVGIRFNTAKLHLYRPDTGEAIR
ncbi:ABC transporter ATP-binding protein [Cohnella hongkongensis]|uniref:ABC transporter ATP-binding protein n=1 Tax=Cohnella hongkongensis TaxID=178337 RepID=A0ABV9F9I7_9BACL